MQFHRPKSDHCSLIGALNTASPARLVGGAGSTDSVAGQGFGRFGKRLIVCDSSGGVTVIEQAEAAGEGADPIQSEHDVEGERSFIRLVDGLLSNWASGNGAEVLRRLREQIANNLARFDAESERLLAPLAGLLGRIAAERAIRAKSGTEGAL